MVRWLDRLLILVATTLVVISLLPLGARVSWVLDLTTHFRLQYVGAIVMLLAACLLRRKWGASAALVAAAGVSLWPVLPYLPRGEPAATAASAPIKIVTVNISYRQFLADRLVELINEEAPDVVVLVEFTPYAARVLAALDESYPYRIKRPAPGPSGIALLSKFELQSARRFNLVSMPAIEARVLHPSGLFTVFGVHLNAPTSPRRAASRNAELATLAARSSYTSGPLIVAGDFNITPYSPHFQDWLTRSGLTDTRRHRTPSISWPAVLPIVGIPIDHVAVSKQFAILGHRRLPHFESDHYGVIAELALRTADKQ